MAGGPILPASIYIGGASGLLSPSFYVPATNTNTAGALEGVSCVASLSTTNGNAPAVLQFNMPETIPTGTLKLRCLSMANAVTGTALFTVADGVTSAGSNIGVTSLSTETQVSQTWATADILVENKVTLTASPSANQILTCLVTFNPSTSGGSTAAFTLAQTSVHQFSIVWE